MPIQNVDPRVFNSAFLANLETPGGLAKQAAVAATFIKDKVRESSFLDEIIPPITLTRAECDRSAEHDEPIKIRDIQPNAEAVALNFRSSVDSRWVQGPKYIVPFYKIMTDRLQKTEGELLGYSYSIMQEVEDIMVKEIARVKDATFMTQANACITRMGAGSATTVASDLNRDTIAAGARMLAAYELNCGSILMSLADWQIWNAARAEDVGNDVASEMVRSGYQSKMINGYKVIVTNKQALVAPGTVYFFAPAEYLGDNFVLSDMKFQIKKDEDLITMVGWGYYGTGIGNIRAVTKVTLPALVI